MIRPRRVTRNDILFLSASFFVVVAAWIGFNIYHAYVTTTITPDLQMQIIPIDPTFDTHTITSLKNREKVNPILDGQIIATPEASLTPTPTPLVELELTQTPTPTPSDTTELLEETDITPTEEPTPTP